MLIVDAHQDLAYNMQAYGRDYTRSVAETRRLERGSIQVGVKEDTLLGWPEYQQARVGIVFATLFVAPARLKAGEWDNLCYTDLPQANQLYWSQVDLYHRLVDECPDKFCLIKTQDDLRAVLAAWEKEDDENSAKASRPVGLVIAMEGAEGVRDLSELDAWRQAGVSIIGPAWAGNRFCGGTREPGRLTGEGIDLLENMGEMGFILDLSHMDQSAVLQALDIYDGTLIASHSNVQSLLKGLDGNRHLSDPVIHGILERNGVIGILPYNAFLLPGWKQGDRRELVTLDKVIVHIDTICQFAGDALHVGIGSDFDGGFGCQSTPHGLDSIADLQKLVPLLESKGYSQTDISAIMGGNWVRILKQALPISI